MIEVMTYKDLFVLAPERWASQYAGSTQPDKVAIAEKLKSLSRDELTAKNINAIIGNTSWTRFGNCDACGNDIADVQVTIGQEPDYESRTATVCISCLDKALAMALEVKRRL